MIRMLLMTFSAAIVFAVAAGGSWYLRQQSHPAEHAAPDAANAELADAAHNDHAPAADAHAAEHGDSELLPVAVREESMSVEELLRFSLGLKDREQKLRGEEEKLREEQMRQKIVFDDIRSEQTVVDGLRSTLSSELSNAKSMMDELNQLRASIISERETSKKELGEQESRQIEVDEQFRVNDKKLSTWLQGMSAESAASVLKEMANDGNLKVAVQLLANFEEREAAKILDAINDPKMLNEFITEFRNLKNARAKDKEQPTRAAQR